MDRKSVKAPPARAAALTESEGSLLSLVLRQQPVSGYELYRLHKQSPTNRLNASKGSVYPLIKRLKARGLIASQSVAEDRRKTELLSCTRAGEAAVADWVRTLDLSDINLDDPLRTKLLSFDCLTRVEQIEWVVEAKALVAAKVDELDAFNNAVSVPYQQLAYKNARETLRVQDQWLDEVLLFIARDKKAQA